MRWLGGMMALGVLGASACSGGGALGGPDCTEAEGVMFCADRVDDDCDDVDEDCPATQPADAAPAFACGANEDPPTNVLAFATLPSNAQVDGGCVFVYQAASGAFYAAARVVDGADPRGPAGVQTGLCSYDYSARKHLFFTTSPTADCEELQYTYPDEIANQLLSNSCRKMVRNLASNDGAFDPDVQFLPGDLEAQEERLQRFDVAEVACLRINNTGGAPYRADEVFVTQAEAPFVMNAGFTAQ